MLTNRRQTECFSDGRPFVTREYNRDGLGFAGIVARERFAWPGGYELMLAMVDGEVLCGDCVRENYRLILESTREHEQSWSPEGWTADGWSADGYLSAAETDSLTCCGHCGRVIVEDWEEQS